MPLPDDFVQRIRQQFPPEESAAFCAAILEREPYTSLRINLEKLETAATAAGSPLMLRKEEAAGRVPWCDTGWYLKQKFPFTFDPLFHAGAYYVQEASSMFPAHIPIPQTRPLHALDLCAAPGGKSTLLRSLLPAGSLLVSNEVMPARAAVLVENIRKWGHPDCLVTSARPTDFGRMEQMFDLILTDVPCSGEGMFRKDPEAVAQWTPKLVENCAALQRQILADVWPALKPGGLLLYSTCTYNTAEDEENVLWIARRLGAEIIPLSVKKEWGIQGSLLSDPLFPPADTDTERLPLCHFFPHCTRGEGFFIAALRKRPDPATPASASTTGDCQSFPEPIGNEQAKASSRRAEPPHRKKGKPDKKAAAPAWSAEEKRTLLSFLQGPEEDWTLAFDEDTCTALHSLHAPFREALQEKGIRLLHSGIPLAQRRGRDLIPHTALALSTALSRNRFPEAPLTHEQALAYLRRDAIQLPPDIPRGFVLLTFRGIPLGFAKNIGNRCNNLYPAEWRIRTTYLPDRPQSLME